MNFEGYLEKMKNLQITILQLLEAEESEIQYSELIHLLDKYEIEKNSNELRSFLYLLLKISKNHHRSSSFSNYFIQIISKYSADIKQNFSNSEIFNIFKSNKKILLYLLQSNILLIDQYVLTRLKKEKFCYYFFPEIKMFLNSDEIDSISKEIPENFVEKRQVSENDSYLCELIRNDSINEFISYINKENIPLSGTYIKKSIFELNSLINKKQTTLIEYAAFYGSIQIFKFLLLNNVELKPSLWKYAIHGKNSSIIHILEENNVVPKDNSYIKYFIESIKCHHNDIANYIRDNYMKDDDCKQDIVFLKHYNFAFLEKEFINESVFGYLCKYNYTFLVESLLKLGDIDVNKEIDYGKKIYIIWIYPIIQNVLNKIQYSILKLD